MSQHQIVGKRCPRYAAYIDKYMDNIKIRQPLGPPKLPWSLVETRAWGVFRHRDKFTGIMARVTFYIYIIYIIYIYYIYIIYYIYYIHIYRIDT